MNVLWVLAHPEPRSLNGALRDEGLRTLADLGHDVRQSDLYAMRWNPVVDDAADTCDQDTCDHDVRREQEKLLWADALVVQFPLWWHSVPAILKGWFDRVFAKGFGFGVRDGDGRVLRYGEGTLAGRRAFVITTAGARAAGMGPRGVHGDAEQVLFPLLHGTLWYTGMSVLPPLVLTGADRLTPGGYRAAAAELRRRLRSLPTAAPIPYRAEHGGDYDEHLVLRPHVAPGRCDLAVHRA
ncbi:NAD(P)H-dependent oxidoreductase [Actinomadura sp. NPDC047616]|uniref:NAD(P)H-dependent oxidoreductase n=1 Tax=Actinomadura sp. NPDC047616 TaxID=3155914 RepID=UPI00340AB5A3